MKNKTGRRILIILLSAAVIVGGYFGVKMLNDANRRAKVISVSNMSLGYYEDSLTAYGTVYDADSQAVYPESSQIISEVYVTIDQEVHAGDPLMAYDMSAQQLSYRMKELEVQSAVNNVNKAEQHLCRLQQATPRQEEQPTPEPTPAPGEEKEMDHDAYRKLISFDQCYNREEADGKPDQPYRFLATSDGVIWGRLLNDFKNRGDINVVLEIREGNLKDGNLISAWTINTKYLDAYPDSRVLYVKDLSEAETVIEEEEEINTDPDDYNNKYTAEELGQMISDAKRSLIDAQLNVRKAQLQLSIMQESMQDGVVYAKRDGIVTAVNAPDAVPQDGSPFLKVSSGKGVYIQASISELVLDKVGAGQSITATNYMDGSVYSGTVEKIDTYPSDSNNYVSGNPNASFYTLYAYIEDEQATLKAGDMVEIRFDGGSTLMPLTVEKAFIRSDEKGDYVMKDQDGRLVKQYVQTGKTYYGQVTVIKDGITEEDYITFPYGDGAAEGTTTIREEGGSEVFYND